ncbi:MAG: cobyric acid synthase [Dermatophilus congolensis]|nr:cobyric acid synthase [Dermatophilus congolensis]
MAGLLIAGTTSDAGKSLIVAGLCRVFAREGVQVAPFKSQNMSNNSMVCPDGTEIGRAQWVQAVAARAVPEAAMNPVLLKPGSDRTSHVVLMGQPHGRLGTGEWATGRRELARAAFEAYDDLAARYDLVVSEGAGSPAEVNLRGGDYVNFGLARAKNLPVVVVGDIDRGGVLAAMYGTWGIVDADDRATLAGWIVNKFRGDVELLRPGLDILAERTDLPVYGVVPWLPDTWLDGEDALTLGAWRRSGSTADAATGSQGLRVAVVGFTRISNATDADALAAEPGVHVEVTTDADTLAAADLVVLPGSRSTLGDLAWLRERGLDRVITERARHGRPVLGICGGYQMLGGLIVDDDAVETPTAQRVRGLGILPVDIAFSPEKTLGTPTGHWRGHDVRAYEIHHGRAVFTASPAAADHETGHDAGSDEPATDSVEPFLDGVRAGAVFGTHWHGAFENDGFRREFLQVVARMAGRDWTPGTGPGFATQREAMLDRVADALVDSLDMAAIRRLAGIA